MRISDEIEVSTIAIDKTTILEIRRSHCYSDSLQCRLFLGGRNLVRVRNIVVAAIFDFTTVEDREE